MEYRLRMLVVLGSAVLGLSPMVADAAPPQMERFLRSVEENDGLNTRLEASIRAYRPVAGDGPMIYLAAAVHVGEASFYRQLQAFLDAQDVVLFESVGWDGEPSGLSDEEIKAEVTRQRANWLGTLIEQQWRQAGEPPESLDALFEHTPQESRALVEGSLLDAWGHPFAIATIEYEGRAMPYVASLGGDGLVGGSGLDGDIITSPAYAPAPKAIDSSGEGIQQQLADALGLVFQLGAMRHDLPNWRNSDMSVEELMEALGAEESEEGGDALFDLLAGRGFMGKVAGVMLKFVGSSPRLRELTKTMLVGVVAQADEIMRAQGGPMGEMLDVLVYKRNEVVIADLEAILRDEPGVRTIAVIYGAGHLAGIEEAILGEMKYQRAGARWSGAIEVDLGEVGFSPTEARMLRSMFERSLERQLGR